MLVALGSTYAALISNDDELAAEVERGRPSETGELAWRLPLHPEYKELTKGTVADLTNAAAKRKAGHDLRRLVPRGVRRRARPGCTSTSPAPPGTSAASTPARAPTGFGVRLLVELVRDLSS